jgi:hypothetical protein
MNGIEHSWLVTMPSSWALLVVEVSARFKLATIQHLVDEFKKLHQVGTVDEYIKKFGRVKAKLLYYDPHLNEDSLFKDFIVDLVEVRYLVEVLQSRRLNNAFNYVYKIELSIEGQHKRYKNFSKIWEVLSTA